jgi:threonyl-tRNA synthetase
MKEMTPLEEVRHSAAHVLAAAVLRLYPKTQLDIGPPTDNGFYYDFDSEVAFTPEVLETNRGGNEENHQRKSTIRTGGSFSGRGQKNHF